MEKNELTLLEKLAPLHPDLKALWDEHVLFEKQLEKLEAKGFLSPAEERQKKEVKKQKLDGKTKLVNLIHQYAKEA